MQTDLLLHIAFYIQAFDYLALWLGYLALWLESLRYHLTTLHCC